MRLSTQDKVKKQPSKKDLNSDLKGVKIHWEKVGGADDQRVTSEHMGTPTNPHTQPEPLALSGPSPVEQVAVVTGGFG
jgi:hypothetical protein